MPGAITYDVVVHRDAGALSPADRASLLAEFDAITDVLWEKPPGMFGSMEARLATPETSFIVLNHGRRPVGFSIHHRLRVDGEAVIYVAHAHVVPEHQGRGLFGVLVRNILVPELEQHRDGMLYCSWRTRSPVVWTSMVERCARVAPDLSAEVVHPDLLKLAETTARSLFPQVRLDMPGLVMRDAYNQPNVPPSSIRKQAHHRDGELDRRFFAHLGSSPYDVIFTLGELRR
jgi:hypothetical protein